MSSNKSPWAACAAAAVIQISIECVGHASVEHQVQALAPVAIVGARGFRVCLLPGSVKPLYQP